MTNPELLSESPLPSISELLIEVARRYKELQEAGRKKLHEDEDAQGYKELLRESNELIAGLPELLREYRHRGGVISERLEHTCQEYTGVAREYIDQESIMGMRSLLTPMGSRVGDPNGLERLAIDISDLNA